jgi:uncharacterized MAPEG superfamily protein
MTEIILYTLLLALFQIWLLPMAINIKSIAYLISNRDEEVQTSALSQRVARASSNLQESLPAFLALSLLAMIVGADVATAATTWLGLRVAYLACYSFGIPVLRSGIWIASIVCMLCMALQIA